MYEYTRLRVQDIELLSFKGRHGTIREAGIINSTNTKFKTLKDDSIIFTLSPEILERFHQTESSMTPNYFRQIVERTNLAAYKIENLHDFLVSNNGVNLSETYTNHILQAYQRLKSCTIGLDIVAAAHFTKKETNRLTASVKEILEMVEELNNITCARMQENTDESTQAMEF